MNLSLHQFQLEVKRSRIGVVLFLLILLVNYAGAVGWVGGPKLHESGRWDSNEFFLVLVAIAFWVSFLAQACGCVTSDSPARPDRFLATRPMPTNHLIGGKALYLLVTLILPLGLMETFASLTTGGTPAFALLAGLEQFLFFVAIASLAAAYAAHWKNLQSLVIATIIGVIATGILGRFVVMWVLSLFENGRMIENSPPTLLTNIQAILFLALGLSGTAWYCSRKGKLYRYFVPALVPLLGAAFYIATMSPWREVSVRPSDQARIDQLLKEGISPHVTSHGAAISLTNGEENTYSASLSVTPHLPGLPSNLEVRWASKREDWLIDEQTLSNKTRPFTLLAQRYLAPDSNPISPALARTIHDHLGAQPLIYAGSSGRGRPGSSLPLNSYQFSPTDDFAGKTARVKAHLVGDVYSWELFSELPVKAGIRHSAQGSSWFLAHTKQSASNRFDVLLSERTQALHTTRSSQRRTSRGRWQQNYLFLLHLPALNCVCIGNTQRSTEIPSQSAIKTIKGVLSFPNPSPSLLTPNQLADAKLLILRWEFIGRVEQEWTSPEFVLKVAEPYRSNEESDQLSPSQIATWFRNSPRLSPDRPATEVEAHLTQFLKQLSRHDHNFSDHDRPYSNYLTTFVPKHLTFLLGQLPSLHHTVKKVLIRAITDGATPEQRHEIIAAIRVEDALGNLVHERGWQADARSTYLDLVQNHQRFGPRFLFDLLGFNDPGLDPIVLRAYRARPNVALYERLRSIPRLASKADEITQSLWSPGRAVIGSNHSQTFLHLALLQGREDALRELFQIVRAPKGRNHNSWNYASLIRECLVVPESDRRSGSDGLLRWIRKHEPSDFVFDPVLQRFILQSSRNSI